MSVPNLIPHKTLCISSYICTCLAFLFTLDFSNTILKLILQFHAFFYIKRIFSRARARVHYYISFIIANSDFIIANLDFIIANFIFVIANQHLP